MPTRVRHPRLAPLAALVLMAVTLAARTVAAPALPPLPEGTTAVIHIDLSKIDTTMIRAALKLAGPAEVSQALDLFDQKLQQALKTGVTSLTVVVV